MYVYKYSNRVSTVCFDVIIHMYYSNSTSMVCICYFEITKYVHVPKVVSTYMYHCVCILYIQYIIHMQHIYAYILVTCRKSTP